HLRHHHRNRHQHHHLIIINIIIFVIIIFVSSSDLSSFLRILISRHFTEIDVCDAGRLEVCVCVCVCVCVRVRVCVCVCAYWQEVRQPRWEGIGLRLAQPTSHTHTHFMLDITHTRGSLRLHG